MDKIILLKYGEIILKGLNRHSFEDLLIKNIKASSKEVLNIIDGLLDTSKVEKKVIEKEEKPYNINFFKEIIIYLLIGCVLSTGAVFVVYYFDTTIKSAEEVETKLGLPVLGIVPKVNRKI